MKALFLYALFVVIGVAISVGIGYYVEKEVSSAASLASGRSAMVNSVEANRQHAARRITVMHQWSMGAAS
jgi:Flp pilus assembly protein TadG